MLLICQHCKRPSAAEARFCSDCGTELFRQECSACHATNELGAQHCRVCGVALRAAAALAAEDVPGMAVKAFLVTYDYNLAGTQARLSQFARSLCLNFDSLQAQGHPKWKEVSLELPQLGQGWSYYPVTSRELGRCASLRPPPKPVRVCTTEQKILGLCE